MKKITSYAIFLLLSVNIFCNGAEVKYTESVGITDNLKNDSISESQLITEISVSEAGDTTFTYRYNKFDYGDLSNHSTEQTERTSESASSPVMSVSSEPVDQSKYVGKISFTENVTPIGARVYSVPIITAPVNSLAPELSITYNSQAVNGVAGYGWSIAGLSAISAVNKNKYYDGNTSSVDLSNSVNCAFSLDGVRMVSNSGLYEGYYEYETAQGFILVKKYMSGNAISYFTAKLPDGSIARYGFIGNTITQPFYPVTEIEDIKGSIINFEYIISGNNYYISKIKYGGKNVSDLFAELHFTYTDMTDSITMYIDDIGISYNKLLKSITSYNKHNGVLKEIGTYTLTHEFLNDAYQLAQLDYSIGSTYLNPLKFKYEYYESNTTEMNKNIGLSLSKYFTDKPVFIRGKLMNNEFNDGVITFPGHASIYGKVHVYTGGLMFGTEYGSLFPADQEILIAPELSSSSQTKSILTESGFQNIIAADYDGDGTDEIVKVNFIGTTSSQQKTDLKITKYKYTNNSFSSTSFNVHVDEIVYSNLIISPVSRSYFWGDFLGEGKAQLLTISHCKDFNGRKRASQYMLIDLVNEKVVKTGTFPDVSFEIEEYIQAIDINGDGRTELCYIDESKTDVYSFSSSGYTKLFKSGLNTTRMTDGIYCGDLNGDGKIDILVPPQKTLYEYVDMPVWAPRKCPLCSIVFPIISESSGGECAYCHKIIKSVYCQICHEHLGNSGTWDDKTYGCPVHGATTKEKALLNPLFAHNKWCAYLSTGKDFVQKEFAIVNNEEQSEFVLIDINNDGCVDLVRTKDNRATVFLNKNGNINVADSLIVTIPEGLKAVPVNFGSAGSPNKFICFDGAVANLFTYSHDHSKANLLTKLIDSFGSVYETIYSDMSSGSTYYPSSVNRGFPFSSIIAPVNLVKNTLSSHNDIIYHYTYQGAVVHRQGLGFCGFEKVETFNNIQRTSVIEEYDPLMFGLKTKIDSPEKRVEYNFLRNEDANKRCNPQLSSVVESDKLTNQESLTSYEYDSFNNPVRVRIDYVRGQVYPYKLINQTYASPYNEGPYFVGLPLEKTITNYTDSDSWSVRESIIYNVKRLPISKITYTGLSGNIKTGEARWEYDDNGNLISEKSAPCSLTNFMGDTYTYDSTGRYVSTKTDASGLQVIYSDYDKFGHSTKITNHRSQQIIKTFDDFGLDLTTTGIDGVKETITKEWGGSGIYTVTKSFQQNANPSETVHYDALQRKVRTGVKRFDGQWVYTDNLFDNRGRLFKTSMPFRGTEASFWNEYSYDDYNRPVSLAEPSGKITTWRYNGLSVTETKDGISSTKTKDVVGQIKKVADAGGEINYTFRPDGQPASVTVNNTIITQFEYDNYGRQISIKDPSAGQITYSYVYDGDILVKTTTDARGKIYTERKDRYDRVVSVTRPEFNTTYTYNSDGQLINETSTNQTSKVINYDAFGRIGIITNNMPNGKYLTKEYKYNPNIGKVSSIKYTSQNGSLGTENYVYHYGHNSNITWGRTVIWDLREENDFGQPLRGLTGGFTRKYTYNQYGLPTGRTVERGSDILQNFTYNFDTATGNLLSRTDVNRNITESFQYDNLNRLISAGGNTITYGDNGNILQKPGIGTLVYGNANKPYQVTGLTPNMGYLLPSMPQTIGFTSFQRPAWIEEDADAALFEYNASHERVKMSVYNQGIDVVSKYYCDSKYELHLPSGGGYKEILYLGGDAYSAPAVYVKEANAGKIYYICRDYLGSITHVLNSGGALEQELSYDAWGRLRNPDTHEIYSSSNQPTLFLGRGYTGHEYLPWFGLINMNARLYDPVLGRFLSVDPLVQLEDFTQGFNRYSYCLNNPLRYTDPSGKVAWLIPVIGAVIGAYIGGVVSNGGEFNPGAWNWKSPSTYMGVVIGGVIGAYGGYGFANPGTIMFGVSINWRGLISIGVAGYSIGQSTGWKLDFTWSNPYSNGSIPIKHSTGNNESSGQGQGERPDADGVITFFEAKSWYLYGDGQQQTVNINSLHLENIRRDMFDANGKYYANFDGWNDFNDPNDALVYGSLGFELNKSGTGFKVIGEMDKYDFDIRWNDGRNLRNVLTLGGDIVNSSSGFYVIPTLRGPLIVPTFQKGTPFVIKIEGEYYFK